MVVGTNKINDDKKCRLISGDFDHHADVVVQCGAYCPIEHILGFPRSHWMPLLGECSHDIAEAAAILVKNTKY